VTTRTSAGWLAATIFCAAMLGVSGCHRGVAKDPSARMSNPEQIYKRAHKELNSNNFDLAIRLYEALEARYPFSDSARQARLDLMYAYYKNQEAESAVDAADQFIRENPTHPRCDYAYYIKGLVYFEAVPNFIERFFRVDLTERPPVDGLKSFAAFQTLVQQYPQSLYAHDAERRMVYLRNRLANYEMEVADYYMKRGAYVAALKRSQYTIEHYDGAPAVRHALQVMIRAYKKMQLPDLAEKAEAVYQANFPPGSETPGTKEKKSWWHFWG
jgi:outer membrane protein assembly factor BamD